MSCWKRSKRCIANKAARSWRLHHFFACVAYIHRVRRNVATRQIMVSPAKKLDAEDAVKRVSGVHGIAEELKIELPLLHRRNDADLAKSAEALLWNSNVPADSVIIKVENGWVTLMGSVDWQYHREATRHAIARLAGVRGVSNEITLRHRVVASDVRAKLRESFRRSAEIDADKIEIVSADGTVTLRGVVHSWTERADAAAAAYSIAGVIDVKNYTTVS
jgi:osmotically-inducible protein OsmY